MIGPVDDVSLADCARLYFRRGGNLSAWIDAGTRAANEISVPKSDNAIDADALLNRERTADALTAAGYPVSQATLATKATRGGGPPYQRFGRKPLYRWGSSLAWAQSKLSATRTSSSEGES